MLKHPAKILILALSGIGDALMFTPAIKLMRQHLPGAQIDALVMFKGVKDIYDRNPNLNNVIHFDFLKEGAVKSLFFMLKLRKKYDVSVNVYPSNRKEYNVINYLLGAKKRAGVRYLRKDTENFGALNNVRVTEDDNQHNVITNIKLVEKLLDKYFNEEPPLEFFLNKEDENYADEYISHLTIKGRSLIVGFHPGSAVLKNHEKRRWEPEKFAELGRRLIEKNNAAILIFGGPEEKELKEGIREKINSSYAVSVEAGNLAQSAAIMKRCSIFVSNDSSLMHVASAMQLKVIAIIGPTNPAYIHPWKTGHKIVTLNLECAPCFIYSPRPLICFRDDIKFKCIKELNVDMVYNTVLNILI
ncbi:MAG: glycosyltransferase family 9 protein [Ignavibacteriaceae bacterium]